ncbi:glycoside hydrolase family 35 protein [Aspergillus alliaceus]|uniref:glycoside hydrolase family 35 protein n=1 Tax=Petromyces alliaceus TaxID=209559 RepID=UPI0012A3E1A8|nr:beta-galactosidase [Aspergillus alliaceus]KAB8229654.1 beta-galactosidase [Aspergillus alliaceus]
MAVRLSSLLDIVTWDQYSISVRGERILLLSGEFHPFRLPSPDLWFDVFEKVRALGYSAVSFYLDWALLEGEQGQVRMDGIFALDKFFDAASKSGVYLIARPGPYINAETSGGGFPGWLARLKGRLRTSDQDFLDAIALYFSVVGSIITKAQVTEGGPVILLQPENEYTLCASTMGYSQDNNLTYTNYSTSCLDKEYMTYVENKFREAGIVVPFIVNDAFPMGNFAPGGGEGAVNIYSFDNYPLGWRTAPSDPSNWSSIVDPLLAYNFPTHETISPNTPFSISEFQAGVPDAWGGVGSHISAAYIGYEFERVLYKINYGLRIAIQNLYMIFGGTNWGNLGHPGGYTSYDVGAAIAENREISREKYSELKLQANFLQASPAYLTTRPENGSIGIYSDTRDILITRLAGSQTSFYIVRHRDLTSSSSTPYNLKVKTSVGKLTLPQMGGLLSLNGRDSKFHVTDYDVGGMRLIYSTAEIFSWKKADSRSVLLLYGGENELHEFALPASVGSPLIEGYGVKVSVSGLMTVVQWRVDPSSRRVVKFNNGLEVYLLWRNEAYKYWVLDLPAIDPLGLYVSPSRVTNSVIVKAGYLIRSASIEGDVLYLRGDVNATTELEVIWAPRNISSLVFNGEEVQADLSTGRLTGIVHFTAPQIAPPDLEALSWHYTDTLPELDSSYDDSSWTPCTQSWSNNPRNLSTPTSLYASDYGYHAGSLLYRGLFVASGNETSVYILTEGGYAFGHSVWLDSTYLGSWTGSSADMFYNRTLSFPTRLEPGNQYVLTVLIDHMGLDENFPANSAITWKMTGNLGGEHYYDHTRGPLNEGGMYAERQGYHLPGLLVHPWAKKTPLQGLSRPGVGFFATYFDLHIPAGYDVPMSIVLRNDTEAGTPRSYRAQLFINGWQFGKYVNIIGPQTRYRIPEGILNYNGTNYLALTLWNQEDRPVKVDSLKLEIDTVVQSGYRKPGFVEAKTFTLRQESY